MGESPAGQRCRSNHAEMESGITGISFVLKMEDVLSLNILIVLAVLIRRSRTDVER